jgi:hypothetical protein
MNRESLSLHRDSELSGLAGSRYGLAVPRLSAFFLALGLFSVFGGGTASSRAESGPSLTSSNEIKLSPIYFSVISNEVEHWFVQPPPDAASTAPAFYAVVSKSWRCGLVAIFGVDKGNRFELRRRPARGQEGFSEPLFFCLPANGDSESTKIAGRWNFSATRDDGSKPRGSWELAIENGQLAGRFDQDTDYRFAFIPGGSFRSNRFELPVEFGMDTFLLSGTWTNGRLAGSWTRGDDGEHGQWDASPADPPITLPGDLSVKPLFEWRRRLDRAVRYRLAGAGEQEGWERNAEPLGMVWVTDLNSKRSP